MRIWWIGLGCWLSWSMLQAEVVSDSLQLWLHATTATELLAEGQEDEAYAEWEAALELAECTDRLTAYINVIKAFAKYQRDVKENPQQALQTYRRVDARWREPADRTEIEALAWLHVHQGFTLAQRSGQFIDAAETYTQAAQVYLDHPEWTDAYAVIYIFQVLGNIHTRLGEYPLAETFLLRSITYFQQLEVSKSRLANCQIDLSTLYVAWGKHEQALGILEEPRQVTELPTISLAWLYSSIAAAYYELEKYDSAHTAVDASIEYFLLELTSEQPFETTRKNLAGVLKQRAAIYHKAGRTDDALVDLARAVVEMKKYYKTERRREIGQIHVQRADILRETARYETALAAYQQALTSTLFDYHPATASHLPTVKQLHAENTIVAALRGKARTHRLLAEQQDDTGQWEHALATWDLTLQADRLLWERFMYDEAKLFTLEETHQYLEEAIALAVARYVATDDPLYQAKAFRYAEQSRSLLLLESFRRAELANRQRQDSESVRTERRLREALANAEEARYQLAGTEVSDSARQAVATALLAANQQYATWRDSTAEHMSTHQLLQRPDGVALTDLQSMLGERAMVSYFLGQSAAYAFVLTQNDLRMIELNEVDRLAPRVETLRRSIEQFQVTGADRSRLCTDYTEVAQTLYGQLIEPLEREDALPAQLLIIPSGILHYLPFDALLNKAPERVCDFTTYPYLLHRYNISLGYSADLQYELAQTELTTTRLGAFAPVFDGRHGWPALECSGARLEEIAANWNGDYFGDTLATSRRFSEIAHEYGLLQLGTHAQANTDDADFSFVVFASADGQGYDSLFVNDIFPLHLQAELVALSACETAVGELYQSEGVISLGRSFVAAGARSVLSTQWKINEAANCTVLQTFYDALAEGQTKTAALTQAKLTYLAQADRQYAHPVYWAAFQLAGNDRAVESSQNGWWMLLGLGVLLGLGYFGWMRVRS